MLPFKARKFSFQTMLNDEQLKERLKTQIHTTNIFSIGKASGLYGTISNNEGIVSVTDGSYRNSFRPVIVFKWSSDIKGITTIRGFYRVSMDVIIAFLILPFFGVWLAVTIHNILPFLFCALLWIIINATFVRWLFYRDFKWIEEEFLNLMR